MVRFAPFLFFLSAQSTFVGAQTARLTAYYDFEDRWDEYPNTGSHRDDLSNVGPDASFSPDVPANAIGSTKSYEFVRTADPSRDGRVSTGSFSSDLTSSDQYTIMFWLKASYQNQELDNTRLASVRFDASNQATSEIGWQIEGFGHNANTGPDLRIQDSNSVGNFFAPRGENILDDTWHHIAFVISNTGGPGGSAYMETYVDGSSVGVRTNSVATGTDLLRNKNGRLILGGHNAARRSATGKMDDFALFDGIVDPSDIESIARGLQSPVDWVSTSNPGAGGDPHFSTLSGVAFDFHGQCDMVLLEDPSFLNGLGLDIHIRTKKRYQYSYIESCAVRIGEDILEVSSFGQHFLNGVDGGNFPTTMGGVAHVTYVQKEEKIHWFEISLDSSTKIIIKTFKDLVSISFDAHKQYGKFKKSVGLLGSSNNGQLVARDGKTILDADSFGQNWQVRNTDAKLFQAEDNFPQFPEGCVMPDPNKAQGRRLGDVSLSEDAARKACVAARRISDLDFCIYDVMATGDLEMAEAGAF